MSGMAAMLSEQEMRDVAWFLGSKPIKPGFAKDKDLVALGERIYRGGVGERSVPACAGCHSPNGAGIPIQYPRLGGQHAEYIAAQLTAFRDGVRLNSVPMSGVAAKLNDREIKAVSDYIAGCIERHHVSRAARALGGRHVCDGAMGFNQCCRHDVHRLAHGSGHLRGRHRVATPEAPKGEIPLAINTRARLA